MQLKSDDYIVQDISISTARNLVEKYHYAKGASNTATFLHGLIDKLAGTIVGCAWWIPPTKNAAMFTCPDHDWRKVLSLSRLVIVPDTPSNAASYLLGRSIRLIRTDGRFDALITYADTYRGHTGSIYKATNWEYRGKTKPMPVWVSSDGQIMGRKRGRKTLTYGEMRQRGFKLEGRFPKHRFRMILRD